MKRGDQVVTRCSLVDDDAVADGELLAWCVVANVQESPDAATGSLLTRGVGTRHFSAGTKVWVLPPQWGDGGDSLFVVGRHRGQRGGLVRMVLSRSCLVGFKVKPVYSPGLMAQLERPWRDGSDVNARLWASRDEALDTIRRWSDTAS